MKKAVVLFNLGGPDKLESVEPFLFNLFNDPAIINIPSIFRYPLAKLIAKRRTPIAKNIYKEIGNKSPILELTQNQAKNLENNLLLTFILIIVILFLTLQSYYKLPEKTQLYENINQDNYEALQFLKTQPLNPNTKVIAPALIATTIYPITGHEPLATTFFYGDRNLLFQFFLSKGCKTKNQIIQKYNVSYVLTNQAINCNWEIIYNKNNNVIYKV